MVQVKKTVQKKPTVGKTAVKKPRSLEQVIAGAPLTKAIGRALGAKKQTPQQIKKINAANKVRRNKIQKALGRPQN